MVSFDSFSKGPDDILQSPIRALDDLANFRKDSSFIDLLKAVVKQKEDVVFASWYDGNGKKTNEYTFGKMWREAGVIAHHLRVEWKLCKGDRVVLCYNFGLHFFAAFLGCLRAGVVAVLVYPPAPRLTESLPKMTTVVSDCDAKLILTDSTISLARNIDLWSPISSSRNLWPEGTKWMVTDKLLTKAATPDFEAIKLKPDDLAFLQYTSGSTGDPKGVMVTFEALKANVRLLHESFYQLYREDRGIPEHPTGFSWLPQYHDLGLIYASIAPFAAGWRMHMMSPLDFVKNPVLWVDLMSQHKVHWGVAPDFAFNLTARKFQEAKRRNGGKDPVDGLDLSNLHALQNCAEQIRPSTRDAFNEAFAPFGLREHWFASAYGLAEHVVGTSWIHGYILSSPRPGDHSSFVAIGCRKTFHSSLEIKVVDPQTCVECKNGHTGEVWIQGPSVAAGYFGKPDLSKEVFCGRLAVDHDKGDNFLRTGDLGFFQNESLFVCGRLKDLIIVNGANYYPQDIEHAAQSASSAVRPGCVAAFSLSESNDYEGIAIVFEIRNGRENEAGGIFRAIRRNVIKTNRLIPRRIVAIKERTIPKTTSGKLKRRTTRSSLHEGKLRIVLDWKQSELKSTGPVPFISSDAKDVVVAFVCEDKYPSKEATSDRDIFQHAGEVTDDSSKPSRSNSNEDFEMIREDNDYLPGEIRACSTGLDVEKNISGKVSECKSTTRYLLDENLKESDAAFSILQNRLPKHQQREGFSEGEMLKLVRSTVAELLGLSPSNVPTDEPLINLGLTSVMAIEMADMLGEAIDQTVETSLFFEGGSSVESIVCGVLGVEEQNSAPGIRSNESFIDKTYSNLKKSRSGIKVDLPADCSHLDFESKRDTTPPDAHHANSSTTYPQGRFPRTSVLGRRGSNDHHTSTGTRDSLPPIMKWYEYLVVWACSTFARLCWGLRSQGLQKVPAEDNVIFVANHLTHMDTLLISGLLPGRSNACRLRVMAKNEHFGDESNFFMRFMTSLFRGIPVVRDDPESRIASLQAGIVSLQHGRSLLVHPEGTRSRDGGLLPFHGGVAALSRRAGCKVVPCYISSVAHDIWPAARTFPLPYSRKPITVSFGLPLEAPEDETDIEYTQKIREAMLDLAHNIGEYPELNATVSKSVSGALISSGIQKMHPFSAETTSEGFNYTLRPKTIHEVQHAVLKAREEGRKIIPKGSGWSRGGQALVSMREPSITIDLSALKKIVKVNEKDQTAVVQAGARWKEVRVACGRQGLAPSATQSYDVFSVGGSIAANAHGRSLDVATVVEGVLSIRVVTADGNLVTTKPDEELFQLVCGGFGLFGIVVEATLTLLPDSLYATNFTVLPTSMFQKLFNREAMLKDGVHFQMARLCCDPKRLFEETMWETCLQVDGNFSDLQVYPPKKKMGGGASYLAQKLLMYLLKSGWRTSTFQKIRWIAETMLRQRAVGTLINRNAAQQEDFDALLPWTGSLVEVFIPCPNLTDFLGKARLVLEDPNAAIILNATIRWVPKNKRLPLSYAADGPCFSIVMFLEQRNKPSSIKETARQLYDAALDLSGTFYLTYEPWYSCEELARAYPGFEDVIVTKKKKYDPTELFYSSWIEAIRCKGNKLRLSSLKKIQSTLANPEPMPPLMTNLPPMTVVLEPSLSLHQTMEWFSDPGHHLTWHGIAIAQYGNKTVVAPIWLPIATLVAYLLGAGLFFVLCMICACIDICKVEIDTIAWRICVSGLWDEHAFHLQHDSLPASIGVCTITATTRKTRKLFPDWLYVQKQLLEAPLVLWRAKQLSHCAMAVMEEKEIVEAAALGGRVDRYEVETKDGVCIQLARVQKVGEQQAPFRTGVFVSGYGTSSFTSGSLEILPHLLKSGFSEVWLVETRISSHLDRLSCRRRLDDVALFDIPAAMGHIKSVTHENAPIHIMGHCAGSLSICMSLASGATPEERITSLTCMNVCLTPEFVQGTIPEFDIIAALLGLGSGSAFGPNMNINKFRSDITLPLAKRVFAYLAERLHTSSDSVMGNTGTTRILLGGPQEAVRGRGSIFNSDCLTSSTRKAFCSYHQSGEIHYDFMQHMVQMIHNQKGFVRALRYNPSPPSHVEALPKDYLEAASRLQLPIIGFVGDKNELFGTSLCKSFDFLDQERDTRCTQEVHIVPNFGHMDLFMSPRAMKTWLPTMTNFMLQAEDSPFRSGSENDGPENPTHSHLLSDLSPLTSTKNETTSGVCDLSSDYTKATSTSATPFYSMYSLSSALSFLIWGTYRLLSFVMSCFLGGPKLNSFVPAVHSGTKRNQIAVITGSNKGVGLATAFQLVVEQNVDVVLACRSNERAEKAARKINAVAKSRGVSSRAFILRPCDLSSFDSVRSFAKAFREEYKELDILILNAGINADYDKHTPTVDNLDLMFQSNILGHFLLTNLLWETFPKSGEGRIVGLSSSMHHFVKPSSLLDTAYWKQLAQPSTTGTGLTGEMNYGPSKLASILLAKEFNRRYGERVRAIAVHPGTVATDLWDTIPSFLQIPKFLLLQPHQGCTTSVVAAIGELPSDAIYLQPYWLPKGTSEQPPNPMLEMFGPYVGYRVTMPRLPEDGGYFAGQSLWKACEDITGCTF